MSDFSKYFNLRKSFRNIFWKGEKRDDDVKALIDNLREFCRADTSCVVFGPDGRVDTHATAIAEGRREVYLRIVQTLNLSDTDLNKIRERDNEQ